MLAGIEQNLSAIRTVLLLASLAAVLAGAGLFAVKSSQSKLRALIPPIFWAATTLSSYYVDNVWLSSAMAITSLLLGGLFVFMAARHPEVDPVDKALGLFGEVHDGESLRVLLLASAIFVILFAYYVLKTVREPLILASGGAELKSYASGAQAIVLIGFVPLYALLASKMKRLRLIVVVTIIFIVCIELFYLGALIEVPNLGFVFYVWVGIFSVSIIAQFWSYANDLYNKSAGERLFPIVAVGATLGPPIGSYVTKVLFDAGIDAYSMLHIAAVLLLVQLGLYFAIEASTRKDRTESSEQGNEAPIEEPLDKTNGFVLVFRNPYIRLIAVLLILLNLVNTTGEYILSSMVEDAAKAAAAADPNVDIGQFIGSFYGEFFSVVNVVVVLIQALLVSRLVKYAGMWGVLFALPLISFGVYGLAAIGVGFTAFRWAKTAENATDYSVMNTAKAMLWLPTTREEKYNAKQTVDTFFVRLGDVMSALLVLVGTSFLDLGITGFASINVVLVVIWAGVAYLLVRSYLRLSPQTSEAI